MWKVSSIYRSPQVPPNTPICQPVQPFSICVCTTQKICVTLTFLLSDEVLHYNIGHTVSEGVSVLIKSMHCAKDELVKGKGPILAANHLEGNTHVWVTIGFIYKKNWVGRN